MKTYDEIQTVMCQSCGTEKYNRLNPFTPFVLATDGVVALCEYAECYWLFDVIGSYYPKYIKRIIEINDELIRRALARKGSNLTDDEVLAVQVPSYTFFINLTVNDHKAEFKVIDEDWTFHEGENVVIASQDIEFTDLPNGEYKLYLGLQIIEDKSYFIVMCPSEY